MDKVLLVKLLRRKSLLKLFAHFNFTFFLKLVKLFLLEFHLFSGLFQIFARRREFRLKLLYY